MRTWAITGHSRGIGLALSTALIRRGDQVQGFDRSSGFDIGDPAARAAVADVCRTNTGFVNNAHSGYNQVDLLYRVWEIQGQNPNYTVITIGSNVSSNLRFRAQPYAVEKLALDAAVSQLQNNSKWRSIHIRPGWVDTPRVAQYSVKKLPVDQLVSAILWALDQPETSVVASLTIEPRQHI